MTLPSSEIIQPEEGRIPPPARRTRRQDYEGEKSRLASLSGLLTPSVDFYFGFIISGLLTAAAILVDAPALFILATLFAPFLGPVFAIPFSAVTTSGKLFLKSIAHLIGGGIIVFGFGMIAGWIATRLPEGSHFNQVRLHSVFSWPDLVVLVVGVGFTTLLLVRSPRQKPLVANIAVAYELALPLAASGFFLTNAVIGSWTAALVVFGVHLAVAAFIGGLMLLLLGLRPNKFFGTILILFLIVIGGAAVFFAVGQGQTPPAPAPMDSPAAPTQAAVVTSTPEPSSTPQPIQNANEPLPPPAATSTLEPSISPTATVTFVPTPVWAKVDAPSGGGAFVREEPDGKILTSLLNGSPVIVISEPMRAQGGAIWVKIRLENGVEGWILQSLLATATPAPGW